MDPAGLLKGSESWSNCISTCRHVTVEAQYKYKQGQDVVLQHQRAS